ncbi:NAD(P)-dependent dehydrogenase (short-subunit alcohol dehydrogenase family) [Rhodoligotrophos appendicifer]|uniref:SDR family oxidoreductase n=1 Tax=Rhodoligotrophos appendicifer TaxID=987056 RepID=UPI001184DB50|nr:SDR family oxidoreductase [Rhodoligotrophos appendicifer]
MSDGIAVVTGGSAGIGLATAQRLARNGWSVAILARDQTRLDEAAGLLRETGARVLPLSVDMADAAGVGRAADQIEQELGPIRVWVNNAMSTVIAPADEISADDYARVTATTYLSQVHGTLAALRFMKPRNQGLIVQISSILGFRGVPLQAPYCAAKFAVSGFTDALRAELIADEINVSLSVVYLPAVNTPQFTWSRNLSGREQIAPEPIYDPRVCAEAVLATVQNPTREVWVGRRTFGLAIGQDLAPAYADSAASGFKEDQLGERADDRPGNLCDPVPGPAKIDGPWTPTITSAPGQIFTSGHRTLGDFALGALAGGLATAGALAISKMIRQRT